jgi:hypothetical protein
MNEWMYIYMDIWTQRHLTTFGIIDRMSAENPLEMAVITCWNCIKNSLLMLLQVHIMCVCMYVLM